MIIEEVRTNLADICPQASIFDNPSYDNSIIGISIDDKIVYDYEKMIDELMKDNNISYNEAEEFIEYNTIRTLPYCENSPIIVHNINNIR